MGVVAGTRVGVNSATQKRLEELQKGYQQGQNVTKAYTQMLQQQAQKPAAYTPSAAVNNAIREYNTLKGNKPGEYTPGDAVRQAQMTLQNLQNNKPGEYAGKYDGALESILQQIQNPEEFKYEFNGDNLFKAYADQYTQRGKQAAMDVQGQAAALTGGYGNSYGQSVGQQQYQQYLTQLYDRGMDLRNAAYQQYLNNRADLKDQYSILKSADESDYGRYRDALGDWRNDLQYATDLYNNERNFDYGKYRDTVSDWRDDLNLAANMMNNERNFDYGMYRDAVGDYQNMLNYYTDLYNNERNFDYGKYADMLQAIMSQAAAEEANYWNQMDMEYKQDQFKYQWGLNQPAAEEGGGGGGGGGNGGGSGTKYYDMGGGNLRYQDANGNWKTADASDLKKNDVVMPTENVAKALQTVSPTAYTAATLANNATAWTKKLFGFK